MSTPLDAPVSTQEKPIATYVDPTARVNLMPPEVLVARKVRVVQRRLVLALVLVVVACMAANVWYRLEDSRAETALRAELATVATLRAGQQQYAELPRIQAVGTGIDQSLSKLMVDDIAWDTYSAALRTPALGQIRLTSVVAAVTDVATGVESSADTTALSSELDVSGQTHIGVLTVIGLAPSHDAVAAWVESLSAVDGFLVPYILGSRAVADGAAEVEFSVEVTLSATVRSLKYEPDVAGEPAADDGGS